MSEQATATAPPTGTRQLWERQLAAIFTVELRRNFLGGRALLAYVLALLPVLLFLTFALVSHRVASDAGDVPVFLNRLLAGYHNIHYTLQVRLVVFFGCAWIFSNLFRAELLDRSLHYYLLMPVRREVLVLGKYVTGVVGATLLFTASTVLSLGVLLLGPGPRFVMQTLFSGSGLSNLLDYLAMTALACVGYGAVFLLTGLLFRNPFIPALVLWGWEFANNYLPPLLKNLSIVRYLHSLSPVPIETGRFALLAEPIHPTLAVAAVAAVSVVFLIASVIRLRHLEISYGLD